MKIITQFLKRRIQNVLYISKPGVWTFDHLMWTLGVAFSILTLHAVWTDRLKYIHAVTGSGAHTRSEGAGAMFAVIVSSVLAGLLVVFLLKRAAYEGKSQWRQFKTHVVERDWLILAAHFRKQEFRRNHDFSV